MMNKDERIGELANENDLLIRINQRQKQKIKELEGENKELKYEMKLLLQKIEDKNEYQRVLEAKIRRLKDRIKILEKNMR